MTVKIDRKIIRYQVQKPEDRPAAAGAEAPKGAAAPPPPAEEVVRDKNGRTAKVIRMHERLERPEVLIGSLTRSRPRSPITRCT